MLPKSIGISNWRRLAGGYASIAKDSWIIIENASPEVLANAIAQSVRGNVQEFSGKHRISCLQSVCCLSYPRRKQVLRSRALCVSMDRNCHKPSRSVRYDAFAFIRCCFVLIGLARIWQLSLCCIYIEALYDSALISTAALPENSPRFGGDFDSSASFDEEGDADFKASL